MYRIYLSNTLNRHKNGKVFGVNPQESKDESNQNNHYSLNWNVEGKRLGLLQQILQQSLLMLKQGLKFNLRIGGINVQIHHNSRDSSYSWNIVQVCDYIVGVMKYNI